MALRSSSSALATASAIVVGYLAPTRAQTAVVEAPQGNTCPDGFSKITTAPACMAAVDILGPGQGEAAYENDLDEENDDSFPSGCYYMYCEDEEGCDDGVWFNQHPTGAASGGAAPICARELEPLVAGQVLWLGDSDVDYWPTTRSVAPGSYNVAMGGAMCSEVVGYMSERFAAFSPSTMVLVCGENDIADGQTAAQAFANFRNIVTTATTAGIRVVSMGTKNEPGTTELHATYAEYDALLLEFAPTLDNFAFVDVNAGFIAIGNPSSLYSEDDLHMTAEGYAHWDRWVAAALADPSCSVWRSDVCINPPADPTTTTTTQSTTQSTTTTQSATPPENQSANSSQTQVTALERESSDGSTWNPQNALILTAVVTGLLGCCN